MVCERSTPESFSEVTDEELVDLVRDGCEPAFVALIQRHRESFLGTALKLVKDESDANDVVQAALVKIYTKLDTFRGQGSFAGWAYRIVRNTGLMMLRSRKRRREVDIDEAPPSAYEPPGYARWSASPDRALQNKQIRRAVRDAMKELSPKYRQAIELREFQGMSMAQMSNELELSVGGVKARLHRARAHMKVRLRDGLGVSPT